MSELKIWEEIFEIPSYEVGEKDVNPMLLEKRVYQGSSGRVYAYRVIEKIFSKMILCFEKSINMLHLIFLIIIP